MKTNNVPMIAAKFIGVHTQIEGKCFTFIKIVYEEAGLSIDFYYQPVITSIDELSNSENIGKIIFLMRKGSDSYLFSHIAIIYDNYSVIHYSRRMNKECIYKVEISSFEEILKVYDLVPNPYASSQNKKVKNPRL
ncbi:MAG: hypothetical protein WC908_02990 [Candidatus Paceibacterota bacterium]